MDERDQGKNPPEEGAIDGDGEGLWAYVTRSVRPLWREERALAERVKAPQAPRRVKKPVPASVDEGRAETFLDRLLHRGEGAAVSPQHPGAGLDRSTDKKLKRGQMEIEARLDLHGHNRDAAYELLRQFVIREAERGSRCVLVITGKGRGDAPGVLRAAVPQWLREMPLRDHVLRFYTAQPQHGGGGALYVLLRRRRDY
jgi:DNA-nicking Smr family endonuclease